MKYIIALLILAPFFVFAQSQALLPRAGLVPGSPFYFLDKLGEAIQEFMTFNPQAKARLQITFAAERVAEIKVVLETKGVEAKGLDVAKSRLQANIAKAASIVSKEKSKGRDVSALAQDLSDKFEAPKSSLVQTFKEQKQALKVKEGELKTQLRAAHRAGDTAQEEALAQELGQVKAQEELLELKEEDIKEELETGEDKIEEEMEAQHKAEKAIREAGEEKQEIIDEAFEEDTELPANVFAEFDNLLAQANSAFQAGNFAEAKNLAKRAEKSLDQIEKAVEELEKKQEKREEAEEAIKDAEGEKQEVISEAQKEGAEIPVGSFTKFDKLLSQAKELFVRENYQGVKQLAERAEDALENVEKEIEKIEKESEKKQEQGREDEEIEEGNTESKEFEVAGKEFSFEPSSITVKSGQKIKIKFRNHGGAVHNLIIEGLAIGTKTINPGDDASFEFTAPAAGTYTFYCSVGSHRQLGMEGKLIVE